MTGAFSIRIGMELLTKPFTLEALTAKVAGMMKDAARSS
jgi:hypothetical protein